MRLISQAELAVVSGGGRNWVEVDGQDDCASGGEDFGSIGGGDIFSMGFADKQVSSGSATDKSGEVNCTKGTVPKITVKTTTTTTSGGGDLFLNLSKVGGGVGGNGSNSTTTTETTVTCVKPDTK